MHVFQLAAEIDRSTISLTAELTSHLRSATGDFVHATLVAEGLLIAPCDAVLNEQLKVAWKIMEKNAEVLRRLAQS